jgi:hypothetical protein
LGNNPAQARALLLPLIRALGVIGGCRAHGAFIDETVSSGDQGTRCRYPEMQGVEELSARLHQLTLFAPALPTWPVEIVRCSEGHPWVMQATVDVAPTRMREWLPFALGGVVVLSTAVPSGCRLRARAGECEWDIEWNLRSDRISQLFPHSGNGTHSRFRVAGLGFAGEPRLSIVLVNKDAFEVPLFRVESRPSTGYSHESCGSANSLH